MQAKVFVERGDIVNKLKLSREKIDIQLGNNLMSITALANAYGCSRA